MRPRILRRLVWYVMLLVPVAAHATTPARGSIHAYAALSGKFAFVPPDGGVTVLDSGTGKVLFHGKGRPDEIYGGDSFFETPHGLVVRSYRSKTIRDESVYRLVDQCGADAFVRTCAHDAAPTIRVLAGAAFCRGCRP